MGADHTRLIVAVHRCGEPADDPEDMRDKWRVVLIPLVMLVTALAHGYRVNQHHESPWIGAGFGMFADIDGPQRVFVIEQVNGESVRLPANTSGPLTAVANYPVEEAFRSLRPQMEERGLDPAQVTILRPVYEKGGYLTWTEVVTHEYG